MTADGPGPTLRAALAGFDKVILRSDTDHPAEIHALISSLGLRLPAQPNSWAGDPDGPHAIWLAPDEWLLLSPSEYGQRGRIVDTALREGLAAVDVSDGFVGCALEGPGARELLAGACSIDLDPGRFGRGQSARSLFAKTPVILYALDAVDATIRLLVPRSYLPHVQAWVADAAHAFD